jgi:hypothetical protein
MDANTCRSCGHFYGENNHFVLQSHCCPQCGEKVQGPKTGWSPYKRIVIAVLAGVLVVLSCLVTSSLLLT